MKYCDLHCDALTKEGTRQVTAEALRRGGCYLQCFAAFISEKTNRFRAALSLADRFETLCSEEGFQPVRRVADLQEGVVNALFTVEEGGSVEGKIENLEALFARGMRMMTLTWNYPNEIGFPNFPDYEGLCNGQVSFRTREQDRGLTSFGFPLVEHMFSLGAIVDVSHGSDKLFEDVCSLARTRHKPFVASHSGADVVYPCARNLTDGQVKKLADCGGVVGLDFCADFLSDDQSAEGQRQALLSHVRAIVNAGGEDVLAIGSDFDGIPTNPYLRDPADMPVFLEALQEAFGSARTEKFAYRNFLRVFGEVCG